MLTLGLAKLSVLLLLRGICTDKRHRFVTLATCCAVLLWTVGGIVALAARCGTKLPWTATDVPRQCIDMSTFWIAMLPVDVITEVIIVTIPILLVIRLQTALSKKTVIVAAFMFRLALVAASIVRIPYVISYSPSTDFTFRTVNTEILNQVVLSVSIISACVPCLKPFLDVFESGQMAVILRNGTPHSASNSYPMRSRGRENGGVSQPVTKAGNFSVSSTHHAMDAADSISSDTRSDEMIINKRMEYTVRYEGVQADSAHIYSQNARHTQP